MIRIGLNEEQKRYEIKKYVEKSGVKNVIVFSPEKMFMELPELDIPIRQIEYKDIEMYITFYKLLEEIDDSYLLVANELMRDRKRSCLIHNCYAKYTNQTSHRMVFNYFPIIENKDDIMILIDFSNSQQHKGFGLSSINLKEYDIQCIRKNIRLSVTDILLPQGAENEYKAEKERLFNELGNKDPDTIPRNLHVWTGKFKKAFLENSKTYIARNKRFNKTNVEVYKNAVPGKNYTIVDMPCRRLEFNDFLRATGQEELRYLSAGLGVDKVYIAELEEWIKEVEYIYAKTGVYTG